MSKWFKITFTFLTALFQLVIIRCCKRMSLGYINQPSEFWAIQSIVCLLYPVTNNGIFLDVGFGKRSTSPFKNPNFEWYFGKLSDNRRKSLTASLKRTSLISKSIPYAGYSISLSPDAIPIHISLSLSNMLY